MKATREIGVCMFNKIKDFFQPHPHSDSIENPDENELSGTMINNGNATARHYGNQRRRSDNISQLDYLQAKLKEKENILEQQTHKLALVEDMLKKLQSENARLLADNNDLSRRLANMEAQIEESRHLEVSSAELLDWIQSVVGYAGNKDMFLSDSEELTQFRNDAKQLPVILRRNGITCNYIPPDAGIGFLHKRDSRISNGQVIAAPMLLRDGVIVAEGILLVPANDNTCSAPAYKEETANTASAGSDLPREQSCNTFSATISGEASRDIAEGTPLKIASGDTFQEAVPENQECSDHISKTSEPVVDQALIGTASEITQVLAFSAKSSEIASGNASQEAVPEKQEYSDHILETSEPAVDQASMGIVPEESQALASSTEPSESAKEKELSQLKANTDNNSFYEFDF